MKPLRAYSAFLISLGLATAFGCDETSPPGAPEQSVSVPSPVKEPKASVQQAKSSMPKGEERVPPDKLDVPAGAVPAALVGSYYRGDGLGLNLDLTLKED